MGRLAGDLLKSGDQVALIAPARSVTPEEMAPFIAWAQYKGLSVKLGRNLYGKLHQYSGSDAARADDFMQAWMDDNIKAIFCARGGYGSVRILPFLDRALIASKTKPLIGYSDITTLHLALGKLGIESIHGMMANDFNRKETEIQNNLGSVEMALFDSTVHIPIERHQIENARTFSGEITGGNLSLVYAALGTELQPTTDGKILFLEDLDEYFYHIDRMMVALDMAGILRNLEALIIGGMSDMRDNVVPFGKTVKEIILEYAHYGFPIVFDFPAGHAQKNYCFKMHAFTTFDGYNLQQTF